MGAREETAALDRSLARISKRLLERAAALGDASNLAREEETGLGRRLALGQPLAARHVRRARARNRHAVDPPRPTLVATPGGAMSHALMIQDWLSVSAPPSAATTIVQNESSWLHVPGYADACFYIEISQFAPNPLGNFIYIQTSPTKDSNFFDAVASGSQPGYVARVDLNAASVGVQPLKIARWADAAAIQTLARFLRWKIVVISNATAFSMTFRIWATMNQAGYK
jgi:hypothetical protein